MTTETLPGRARMTAFEAGRLKAERICGRDTKWLLSTRLNTQVSRRGLAARVFRRGRRRFLDGFLARLDEEVFRRAEAGDPDAGPWRPPAAPPRRPRVVRRLIRQIHLWTW